MLLKFSLKLFVTLVLLTLVRSDVNDQDALLYIQTNASKLLILSSKNTECFDCKLIPLAQFSNVQNTSVRLDTFRPSYYLFLQTRQRSKVEEFYCEDYFSEPFQFGENGTYLLEITADQNESSFSCRITNLIQPESLYEPIYVDAGIILGAAIVYILLKYLYRKYYHVLSTSTSNRSVINSDLGSLLEEGSLSNTINAEVVKPTKVKSNRMKSIDVFRGLSLCIMIFVNYGSGGYSFLVSQFHYFITS
jgi:hypothetical protein